MTQHPMRFDESGLAAIYPPWLALVRADDVAPARERGTAPGAGIAVIPIHGAISRRSSMWTEVFGGTALDALAGALAEAVADPSVRAVVLDVDSPGGGVYGVDEAAALIAEINKHKPVIAFANGLAASAAYWLIAGAAHIVALPSAEVGSIGVYAVHLDMSQAMANEGVVPTVVKAGTFKAEGNPFYPLSDEDRVAMQSRIDGHYTRFVERVAKGRGASAATIREGERFGRGRVLMADQAAPEHGGDGTRQKGYLVDSIGGWADVLRIATAEARTRTQQNPPTRPRVAASDELLRLRIECESVAI